MLYFCGQIKSQVLCKAIGRDDLSCYFEEGHVAIIQHFLNPDLMMAYPELSSLGENDVQDRNRKLRDPLLDLFKPPRSKYEGRSGP